MSPGLTTSRGSLTKVLDVAETCTKPSWCTKRDAPKSREFLSERGTTADKHHRSSMPGNDGAETALRGWAYRIRSAPGDRQGVIGESPRR
jgi:hypothetical protein